MIFHQHACIDKVSNIRNQDAVAQKKNEEKRTAKKREEYVVTRQPPVAKTSDAQKSTSYTRHPTLSDKCLAPHEDHPTVQLTTEHQVGKQE